MKGFLKECKGKSAEKIKVYLKKLSYFVTLGLCVKLFSVKPTILLSIENYQLLILLLRFILSNSRNRAVLEWSSSQCAQK